MLKELRPLMRIAGPVILAEVGWMSMGLVDTVMVGPLGPAAIAATGMGSAVFTAIAIFGMGLMLGLDAFVSQAHGAGDERELASQIVTTLADAVEAELCLLCLRDDDTGALQLRALTDRAGVYGGQNAEQILRGLAQRAADSSLARAVPAISALAITAAGLAIAVQAARGLF